MSDFFCLYDQLSTMAEEVTHRVGFKIDLRHVLNMPSHFLLAGQYVIDRQPPNHVMTIVVSNSLFVINTVEMFRRAFPALSDQFIIRPSLGAADEVCRELLVSVQS